MFFIQPQTKEASLCKYHNDRVISWEDQLCRSLEIDRYLVFLNEGSQGETLTISPITVYRAINEYAAASELVELNLEPDIYAATTSFNKRQPRECRAQLRQHPFQLPKRKDS